MDIKEELSNNHVNLFVIHNETYNKDFLKFVKKLSHEKICLVTINKGYSVLVEDFKKNNINTKNFSFIDCVTKTVTSPKKEPNCIFLPSPNNLTEMSLAMSKFIDSSAPIILIDSLSNLLIYHKPNTIIRFVHHIMTKVRNNVNIILVLIISKADRETELFKGLQVMVDETIEFKY